MIDDHVHPFPLTFEALDPAGISLAGSDRGGTRVSTELLLARLAAFLGCDPDDPTAVVAQRDDRARSDWTGHLRRLFDDADIAGLIVDDGLGTAPPRSIEDYRETTGRPVWRLARLEPVIDDLLEHGASTADVLEQVTTFMADSAAGGCVGFKTIIAYRTGLAVAPDVDIADADRSLDPGLPVRRRGKTLRDLVLRTACGVAADLDLPIQVHTGFGDPELRLAESNPLLLEDLLRCPEGTAATIVLIHGSHPWEREAAYLAMAKPNVYTELSLSNLFAPLGTADRLLTLLDLAPREKVLVGSDGHGAPETIWFGCRMLAEAWQTVAERLLAAGLGEGRVAETRDAVFDHNARRVYRLAEH
jgi:hypothetical protein